jgi:hypothetical protein
MIQRDTEAYPAPQSFQCNFREMLLSSELSKVKSSTPSPSIQSYSKTLKKKIHPPTVPHQHHRVRSFYIRSHCSIQPPHKKLPSLTLGHRFKLLSQVLDLGPLLEGLAVVLHSAWCPRCPRPRAAGCSGWRILILGGQRG